MAVLNQRAEGRRGRRGAAGRGIGAIVLLALAATGGGVRGASEPAPAATSRDLPEYVIKAGFLFNFAKYVDWPAAAFESPTEPIRIGVVGKDPFGEELDRILKEKTVKDRTFRIERFADAASIRRCHILFVARSEKEHLAEVLGRVDARPVLTVGEDEGFSMSGGVVTILVENERPRLEINPEAAGRAGLTISTKLLKAATIVKTGSRR